MEKRFVQILSYFSQFQMKVTVLHKGLKKATKMTWKWSTFQQETAKMLGAFSFRSKKTMHILHLYWVFLVCKEFHIYALGHSEATHLCGLRLQPLWLEDLETVSLPLFLTLSLTYRNQTVIGRGTCGEPLGVGEGGSVQIPS